MAAISTNGGFSIPPGINPNSTTTTTAARLPTTEFFELFKNHQQQQQQQNLGGAAAQMNPAYYGFLKLLLERAHLASAASQNITNHSSSDVSNTISTPALMEAAAAAMGVKNKRTYLDSKHLDGDDEKPKKRSRIGGQSVKTAEVWRFFVQIPNEQAATCNICSKTIKATNSSTTGMIRHLKSCHKIEHEILEKARQMNGIRKVLKSGMIDSEQEMALLQQLQQNEEEVAAEKDHENHRISETVESVAASTSSNASETDVQIKNLHTIERLILSPKNLNKSIKLEHDETFSPVSIPKVSTAKRGRPPKISNSALDQHENILTAANEPTSLSTDFGSVHQNHNKLFHELSILFTFNVLPIEIMDNQLFRNFLRHIVPGSPSSLPTAEEFRTKIIPSYSNIQSNNNNNCFNTQAFFKNNNFLVKTPTSSRASKNSSRVNSEGGGHKAASPAHTNESGFHDEDESHQTSTDQSSVADSFFSDILNLCASVHGTPTSQHSNNNKSPNQGFGENDSVISDDKSSANEEFENMFDELLDHIGHGIFPKENLHLLVIRFYNAYTTVKFSKELIQEILKLLDEPFDSDLDEIIAERENVDDIGMEMNVSEDKKTFPKLWNCIAFALTCFNEINTLIEKDLVSCKRFNSADHELLVALHHNIINPEN